MFVSYSEGDYQHVDNAWLQQQIHDIQYVRTSPNNWTLIEKWVQKEDGNPSNYGLKSPQYKHFVPWKVIFDHLLEQVQGKTRIQAIEYLRAANNVLQLTEDDLLLTTDPFSNVVAYNTWLTWGFESICNYPRNIYYGVGKGDKRGTTLDIPNGKSEREKRQLNRMLEACAGFLLIMPNLESWLEYQFQLHGIEV